MKAEDVLALLDIMRRDPVPPPAIEPERMARLFAELTSWENELESQTSPANRAVGARRRGGRTGR